MAEIEEIRTVVTNEFRKRQADSFGAVGGGPQGWTACEILDVMPNGEIVFDIPLGYEMKRPYTGRLSNDERRALHDQLVMAHESSGGIINAICELCGHLIGKEYPIKNDAKKLLVPVGSSCVGSFMGAGYITKQITIFKETALRKQLKEWLPRAIAELDRRKEPRWPYFDMETYRFYKKLKALVPQETPEGFKMVPAADGIGFRVSEDRNPVKLLSATRVKNVFKKARQLGIQTPEIMGE